MRERIRSLLINLFFPQQNHCHLCGRALLRAGYLCPECEAALKAQKLKNPEHMLRPLAVCVSVYPHSANARECIHLLKYSSDTVLAVPLGQDMAALRSHLGPIDAVLPVPMHEARLRSRGYNQAALLADAFCAAASLPCLPNVLFRVRQSGSQVGRSRAERLSAMRGCFAVADAAPVRGLHLLLVDDVLTTGATAIACAETLLAAGAASVSLVTFCRA